MDAKAEAEKRWAVMDTARIGSPGAGYATGFEAGAAWALREFGDLIGYAPEKRDEWHEISRQIGHTPEAWRMYAHHIADGIESDG